MLKKLIIFCEGGFGNRLNSLYSGMALGINCDLEVSWPINHYCGADFNDLFKTKDFQVNNFNIEELIRRYPNSAIFSHRKLNENQKWFNLNLYLNKSKLIKEMDGCDIVIFTTPLWLFYTPLSFRRSFLNMVSFNEQVISESSIATQKRGNVALHIRGSDYGHSERYFNIHYQIIKFYSKVTFNVFTDDEEIIIKFEKLNNIIFVTKKNNLPEKLITNQSWNYQTDTSHQNNSYNIIRNRDVSIVGVRELLLLSRYSIIIPNSRSTFLFNALLYSSSVKTISVIVFFNKLLCLVRILKFKILTIFK